MNESRARVLTIGSDILKGMDSVGQPYLRVLVVDDNDDDGALLRAVLPKAEYRVDLARTATEAIPQIIERRHDLYIVDFSLPDMTGVELVRACQTRGVEGPFVIWTGHDHIKETAGLQVIPKRMLLEPAGSFGKVVRCTVDLFRRMHSACLDSHNYAHA